MYSINHSNTFITLHILGNFARIFLTLHILVNFARTLHVSLRSALINSFTDSDRQTNRNSIRTIAVQHQDKGLKLIDKHGHLNFKSGALTYIQNVLIGLVLLSSRTLQ